MEVGLWESATLPWLAVVIILLFTCYFDYRDHRIPNLLMLLLLIVAVWLRYSEEGIEGIGFLLLQSVGVGFLFYCVYQVGGLGAGDVKLFGIVSGCLQKESILPFLMTSWGVAAVIAIGAYYLKRPYRQSKGIAMCGPVVIGVCLYICGCFGG